MVIIAKKPEIISEKMIYFSFVLICFFCPQPQTTGEQKTKPTQSSVRELRGLGLSPDLVSPIPPSVCNDAVCDVIVHCFGKFAFHNYLHIYCYSSRFVAFFCLFFRSADTQAAWLILSTSTWCFLLLLKIQQTHNPTTPRYFHGQVMTCTITIGWHNNITLGDRVVFEENGKLQLCSRHGVISEMHV